MEMLCREFRNVEILSMDVGERLPQRAIKGARRDVTIGVDGTTTVHNVCAASAMYKLVTHIM